MESVQCMSAKLGTRNARLTDVRDILKAAAVQIHSIVTLISTVIV